MNVDYIGLIYINNLTWSCKTQQGKDCMGLITEMKKFYTQAFFPKGDPNPVDPSTAISNIYIELQSDELVKTPFGTLENYTVQTNKKGIFISAANTFACSRALATVSQLIEAKSNETYKRGLYGVQNVWVQDEPKHEFRSLMLDSSRHFLKPSTILRQARALAMAKLNVLHLHIIDSQSNSFQPITPPATDFGKAVYYTAHAYKLTVEDLTMITKICHDIGVHVMVEVDMPGHAQSWRLANKEISANCPNAGIGYTSIDPTKELTYTYIRAYLKDIFDAMYKATGKTPLIHLGGDEVDHSCWTEDPVINKYMADHGLNTQSLWREFHGKLNKILAELSPDATKLYWQESWENQNPMNRTSDVVHIWYNIPTSGKATQDNYRIIRSQGWYLDVQQPGQSRWVYQESWIDFWKIDTAQNVAQDKKHLVIGGGACMWGERVNDGNIDEQIWPRTIAVAEVLWSNPADRTVNQFLRDRFQSFACKLVQVGVGSGPFHPSAPCPGMDGAREVK